MHVHVHLIFVQARDYDLIFGGLEQKFSHMQNVKSFGTFCAKLQPPLLIEFAHFAVPFCLPSADS